MQRLRIAREYRRPVAHRPLQHWLPRVQVACRLRQTLERREGYGTPASAGLAPRPRPAAIAQPESRTAAISNEATDMTNI